MDTRQTEDKRGVMGKGAFSGGARCGARGVRAAGLVAAIVLAGGLARGDDFAVAVDETQTLTAAATYGNVDVQGQLILDGKATVVSVTNKLMLVPGRGVVTVRNNARLAMWYNDAFVVAASDAEDVPTSVPVLNLEGPATVTMDVVNKSSVTSCVAVSGTVAWGRRNGYKWDGTFGKGGPWRVTVAAGGRLTFDHGNQGGHLNDDGVSVRFEGAGDLAFAHVYNASASGAFRVQAGADIANTGCLFMRGDKSGVWTFCNGSRVNGPTNVVAQGAPCAWIVNAGADVTVRNLTWNRSGDTVSGTGRVTVDASEADVVVAANVPACVVNTTDTPNTLAFVKTGTHDAVFAVTNLPALTVGAGCAVVTNDCRMGRLVVAAGATLIVDGGRIVCSDLEKSGEIVCRNGGAVSVKTDGTAGDEAGMLRTPLWSMTELVKTGDTDLIVYDPEAVAGFVHVAGGALRFSKRGLSDKYFRLTFKECWPFWYSGQDRHARLFSKIGLYDSQDKPIHMGWGENAAYGTPAIELKAGQVTAPVGTVIVNSGAALHAVVIANDITTAGYMPEFDKVQTNAADTATWQEITARFYADKPAIDGLNFYTGWEHGSPRVWTVETSATGQDGSWRMVMDVANAPSPPNKNHYDCIGGDKSKPAYHFRYVEPGVTGLADVLQIQVDGGAVLDFTSKTGGQTVDCIVVDLAAGGGTVGTVSNVVFAASGVVELKGVSRLPKGELPLICAAASGEENLANWTVAVAGRPRRGSVSLRGERLNVSADGMLLLIR